MGTEDRAARRAARRARLGFVADHSVLSPCIAVCQMDDLSGLCIGCARTLDEIREWPILGAEDKRAILTQVAARRSPNAR